MVDDITRLDKAEVSEDGKTVTYNYTITDTKGIDMSIFKSTLSEMVFENVKTNPQLKIFRTFKITMVFKYLDSKGGEIATVKVTPEDYKDAD